MQASERLIHDAARRGDADEVRSLIDSGARPDARDREGSTALFHAKSPEIVRLLLDAGADPRAENDKGDDALQAMLEDKRNPGRLEGARLLLDAGVDIERRFEPGETRLSRVAFVGAHDSVAFLLGAGADPRAGDPLFDACWWGSERNASWERIIHLLVAAGASVEEANEDGDTPMHWAAHADGANLPAIRALLAHGARVDPVDRDGMTPLMLAAQRGEVACIQLLLESGADPALEDNEGWTALDHAHDHHEICVEIQRGQNKPAHAEQVLAEAGKAVHILEQAAAG